MDIYNKPIIIYFSLKGCQACNNFKNEWNKVKDSLRGKANFVEFVDNMPRKYFEKYVKYFPTIIMVNPTEYYKFYNINNQPKITGLDNYTIPAELFSIVYDKYNDTLSPGSTPFTAQNVIFFYEKAYNKVMGCQQNNFFY